MAKAKRQQDTMTITFKPLTVPTFEYSEALQEMLEDGSGKPQLELADELISEIAEREGWWPEIESVVLHNGGSEMKLGSWFDPAGYEQVASIDGAGESDPSTFIVLHNNSTHYLVVLKPCEGRGGKTNKVRLMKSLRYDERNWRVSYSDALQAAATMAAQER